MAALDAAILALAAGEPLPSGSRDRALTGEWSGYRECEVQPGWVLVYHIRGEALVLTLIRTGARAELYRREGGNAMRQTKALRTLIRSPLKTARLYIPPFAVWPIVVP